MRSLWLWLVVAACVGLFQRRVVEAASGKASFRDFRRVDPADTMCKPDTDFHMPGASAFVAGITGLNTDERLQCGMCLRVMNPVSGISTVVRLIDTATSPTAALELSVDAFAAIASLDDHVVDVKFKIAPCEEQIVQAQTGDDHKRNGGYGGGESETDQQLSTPPSVSRKRSGMPKHKRSRLRDSRKAAYRKIHGGSAPDPHNPVAHQGGDIIW